MAWEAAIAHSDDLPGMSSASTHATGVINEPHSHQRSVACPPMQGETSTIHVNGLSELRCEPAVLFVPASQCRQSGWISTWKSQSALRLAAVACAAALVCAVLLMGFSEQPREAATELVWNPMAMEESTPEDHDLWGGQDKINELLRIQATKSATRVSRVPQHDDRMGVILARATHVAFDTVVEIKRAMRGMRGREADYEFNSKIDVVETMLSHLLEKLGISSVPPPPPTSRQASLANAVEMARALRLMLSNLPDGSDARDYREARYNLAVYDLDQVSRQINEIMLMLSSQRQYVGLREPRASQFDLVLHDSQEGLAAAEKAYGARYDEGHQASWEESEQEAKWNLLPRWKRELERYQEEGVADEEEPTEEEEEEEPEEGEEGAEPEEEAGAGEEAAVEQPAEVVPTGENVMQERLVQQAVASAVQEDATAEATEPTLIPSERRVEAAAVSSAIQQLRRTRTGSAQAALRERGGGGAATELLQVGAGAAAEGAGEGGGGGKVGEMLLETEAGRGVLSWMLGGGKVARAHTEQDLYALKLAKEAVYAATKKGMEIELKHPGWHLAVENSASVAVDAAIRADTGLVGGVEEVERAAVEGATKAAEEEEMAAGTDAVSGKTRAAIAERVENAAVRAAILAGNGMNQAAAAGHQLRAAPLKLVHPIHVVRAAPAPPHAAATVIDEQAVPSVPTVVATTPGGVATVPTTPSGMRLVRPAPAPGIHYVQQRVVPTEVPPGMRLVHPVSVGGAGGYAVATAPIKTTSTTYSFPGFPLAPAGRVGGAPPAAPRPGPSPSEAVEGAAAAAKAAAGEAAGESGGEEEEGAGSGEAVEVPEAEGAGEQEPVEEAGEEQEPVEEAGEEQEPVEEAGEEQEPVEEAGEEQEGGEEEGGPAVEEVEGEGEGEGEPEEEEEEEEEEGGTPATAVTAKPPENDYMDTAEGQEAQASASGPVGGPEVAAGGGEAGEGGEGSEMFVPDSRQSLAAGGMVSGTMYVPAGKGHGASGAL